MFRRAFVLLATTLALGGCAGAYQGGGPMALGGAGPAGSGGLPAPSEAVPAGQGIAILAPLSGPNAALGPALVAAAKLALAGGPRLDVRDTGGTPAGAAAAASAAIAAGAGILIGPLTAGETQGAAGPARQAGVPLLAFTNDPAQAHPGVWVLGITPAQQVRRMVGAMTAQGRSRFAAVLPESQFGSAMGSALVQAVAEAGLPPPMMRSYAPGMAAMNAAMRDISDYAGRRGPIDAEIRAARNQHTVAGRKRAAELARHAIPPAPFDALLLAATGDSLGALATLLPYYDLNPPQVRVLGPALWASPVARGATSLTGAVFAAPDPAARADFDQKFTAATGAPAPGIADFAHDAAAIARVLAPSAGGAGYSAAALCRPDGFAGVDGLLALRTDGTVRRGLALFELQRGGPQMIEPAPDNLSAPGI
ncbi:MAG: penicillin-binding protein activator [Rhodospirillales bacterium]|nr:penicillin-binding protein activator [Rhodospirillales bacterium]